MKVIQSCPTLWDPMDSGPWNSPGQNTGKGCLSLFQGILASQGLNPGLPHCRWILYQLSHWGSPKVTLVVKKPPASAGDIRDVGLIPGSGRFPGGGHGHPFQCSCPENPMGRRAWWAMVLRITKSQTWLK